MRLPRVMRWLPCGELRVEGPRPRAWRETWRGRVDHSAVQARPSLAAPRPSRPAATRVASCAGGTSGILPGGRSRASCARGTSGILPGVDGFEHGGDMSRHLDVAPLALQAAIRSDQERAADHAEVVPAVKDLVVDHVERAAPGLVGIGHQVERQIMLGGEAVVRFHRIARHADDDRVAFGKLGGGVTEVLRLARAAGRVVLRVKIYNDELAGRGVFAELDRLAAVRRPAQVWNLVANLHHCVSLYLLQEARLHHEDTKITKKSKKDFL